MTLLASYIICYTTTLVTATIGIIHLLGESLLLCLSARSLTGGAPTGVQYSPLLKACVPTGKPGIMAVIWGAPVSGRPMCWAPESKKFVIQILFELITAGLTAAKAYEHRKAVAKSQLLRVLYRDAAIVFTVSALLVSLG